MARTPERPTNCPRCGGRLARDNNSGRCTPCQAAERGRLISPQTLPAVFWEHEPIRQAVADRHLGRLIRAYRCHPYHGRHPLPQETVARWLGITQAQLSRIENGPAVVHLDRLTHWAQLLRIPPEHLWFNPVNATPSKDDRAQERRPSTTTHGSLGELDTADAPDTSRRALLAGIAAVAAGAGLLSSRGRPEARRVGATDVARINAIIDLYQSVDYEYGGGLLYREVNRFAESVSGLLDWTYSDSAMPELIVSIAAARQLAGWTAFDAGRHAEAQRHFVAAERAAVWADDKPLSAKIRYCQVRQLQHLRHNSDALATLQIARAHLGSAGTPAIMAMLYGAEAASLAAHVARDDALNSLGKARDQFDRIVVDREPAWMRFYDRGEMLAQYGRVYRDLAREEDRYAPHAVRWVRDAVNAFGPSSVRSTVLNEIGLCSAHFLADDPQEALAVGARVVKHADQLTSRRIFDRIRNLRRDLARHRHLPEVAAFDQSLGTL